jgi:hypothetical protein
VTESAVTESKDECTCVVCGRTIEMCACCDEGYCGEPICHRDLLFALKESIVQPHGHGG